MEAIGSPCPNRHATELSRSAAAIEPPPHCTTTSWYTSEHHHYDYDQHNKRFMRVISPFTYSDLQLLEIQINTLFLVDPEGRLHSINEPGTPPAPRFFMGRTSNDNLWRVRYDLPAEVVDQLNQLCRSEPHHSLLTSQPEHYQAIRAVLANHAPIVGEYRGPAYWLPTASQVPPHVMLLSEARVYLVRDTFPWLIPWLANPSNGPVTAVIEQGKAVSVCFCSRITQQAAEAGVNTLEAFRGKGYATAAVAGWAAAIQQSQRIALYSTSWENQASQSVAKKIRAVLYGEDWSIR
jgi:RimJ/RimL family protein N-acetyltransferase